MTTPRIGDTVHYVNRHDEGRGNWSQYCRAAIVCDIDAERLYLTVFPRYRGDLRTEGKWATPSPSDQHPTKTPGTWHHIH